MIKLKEVRGTVSNDGTLNITISLGGVVNAVDICEALGAVNAMSRGQLLDGGLAFVALASRIYSTIKSNKR